MAAGERKSNWIIDAAIFIFLEIAALAMLSRSSLIQTIWLDRASHRVATFFWGGGDKLRNYLHLESRNEYLSSVNAELNAEVLRLRAIVDAIPHTDSIASIITPDEYSYVHASIVRMTLGSQHNTIVLDKGLDDGIRENSGIITPYGAIGIVNAVDKHHSYARSFMNSNISVSARIGRTGLTGPLVWDGLHTDGALITDVPVHIEIAPGDTVWTSGISDFFPAGIPLGITGERSNVFGYSSNVNVKLFQDFRSLRFVTVVRSKDTDDIIMDKQ